MLKVHSLFATILTAFAHLAFTYSSRISVISEQDIFLLAAVFAAFINLVWFCEIRRIDTGTVKPHPLLLSIEFQHHGLLPILFAVPSLIYIAIFMALATKNLIILLF